MWHFYGKLVNRLPLCFRHSRYLQYPPQGEWNMDRIIHKKTNTVQKPGLLHLISVTPPPPPPPPPGWVSSCPWRLNKITFTPEDVEQIWVFPLMWVYLRKNLGQPLKNFVIFDASPPQKMPFFFTPPLKKSNILISLSWRGHLFSTGEGQLFLRNAQFRPLHSPMLKSNFSGAVRKRPRAGPTPALFLDQTDARRPRENFFWEEKNTILFKLFWCKVFVHWKLKLLDFLMDSESP